jgi:hypothetical protein
VAWSNSPKTVQGSTFTSSPPVTWGLTLPCSNREGSRYVPARTFSQPSTGSSSAPRRGITTARRPARSTVWLRNDSTPTARPTGPLTSSDALSSTRCRGSAS